LVPHRAHWLLQDWNFIRVWATGAICNTVRWLEFLAVGLFVLELTGSPFYMSMIAALRLLPLLLFGSLTGAIADRINRCQLLAAGLVILIMMFATLGTLAIMDTLRLWHIGASAFISGLVLSTEHSVRRALLGEISGVASLGTANGLDRSTDYITLIAGPLIGGLVFQTIGLLGTCIVACGMLGIAFCLIASVRFNPTQGNLGNASIFSDIQQGLRFALNMPTILRVLITTVIFNFCVWPLWTLLPVVAKSLLELDPVWTGILMSMTGIGSLVGALSVAMFIRPAHYQATFFYGSTLFLLAMLVFTLSAKLWISAIIFVLAGIGLAGFATMQTTIIFSVSPPHMRSTILGIVVVCIGTSPLGIVTGGILAEQLGATVGLSLISLGGLLAMGLVGLILKK